MDAATQARSHLVALVLVALGGGAAAQGRLWVVDDDGGAGVDFTDIQAAVDAALDGDGILIRAGSYGRFTIDAKSLELVGEDGAAVNVNAYQPVLVPTPVVRIRNLAADQHVLWQNLDISNSPAGFNHADGSPLVLADNQGAIWIENSSFLGGSFPGAVAASGCAAVVIARCEIRASQAANSFLPIAGPGLGAEHSSVVAFDSQFTGGLGPSGTEAFTCPPLAGAPAGLEFGQGDVSAYGSTFVGGAGGNGILSLGGGFSRASDGGPGARLSAAEALFRYQDSVFVAGLGGTSPDACDGLDGQPLEPGPGIVLTEPGVARSLSSTTPVREGDLATFTFRGADGDLVFLDLALTPVYLPLPGIVGPLLTGFPATSLFIGALGPSEELTLPLTVLPMAPGLDFRTFYLQSATLSNSLELFLGAPTAWVVLDAAF